MVQCVVQVIVRGMAQVMVVESTFFGWFHCRYKNALYQLLKMSLCLYIPFKMIILVSMKYGIKAQNDLRSEWMVKWWVKWYSVKKRKIEQFQQVPSGQPGLRSGHATSPATEANHPEGQPGSSARRPGFFKIRHFLWQTSSFSLLFSHPVYTLVPPVLPSQPYSITK